MRTWGATIGLFHRLARNYPGPPPGCQRSPWTHEYSVSDRAGSDLPEIQAAYAETVARVAALPRTPESFGPIHGDLHQSNLHWTEDDRCHVFDFDDMMDFWFVSDLAVVLYYEAMGAGRHQSDRRAAYARARPLLLEGYHREHTIRDEVLGQIPLFMSLREQDLRAAVLRSVPPSKRTEWHHRFLADTARRIRAGEPALGLDARS